MKGFLGCKELGINDEKSYNELSIMTEIDPDISQFDIALKKRIEAVITAIVNSLNINRQAYSFELFVRINLCADGLFSEESSNSIDLVVAVGEDNESSDWFVDEIDLKPYLCKTDLSLITTAISRWVSNKLMPDADK